MVHISRRSFGATMAGASGAFAFGFPALSQQLKEVTIGLASASLGIAGVRVAQELGLFARQGLTARFVVMDSPNAAIAALISKSVDAVLTGPSALISAVARGQKIVTIANAYAGSSTTMVITKAAADKSGVAANAPVAARLKATDGLLIGTPDATSASTIAFKAAAAAVGFNMRFTYLAQTAMPVSLDSGVIDGFLASAPFWAAPVVKGTAVVWVSGPKGDLPAANTSSSGLQVMHEVATANPDLMKRYAAVFADLRKVLDERSADAKAAVSKLFPDLDPKTLDVLYGSESSAWNAKPMTAADFAREIEFIKASGTNMPGLENIKPSDMMYP